MPVVLLPALPVDGNIRIQWVPAIADPTAPKLSTEVNATGSVDMSCYMTAWNEAGSQVVIPDVRVCSTQDFETPGKETRTLDTEYIENPGTTNVAVNKAYTTLTKNTTGFFVVRRGVLYTVALAVGDLVDVWPVKTGLQIPMWASGQTGKMKQKQFVTGPVFPQVAIVT